MLRLGCSQENGVRLHADVVPNERTVFLHGACLRCTLGSPSSSALLYELLPGKLPHAQLELAELALFVTNYDLPSLAEEMPTLPRQLTSLIERCVRRDPSERASIYVVRNELEALVAVYLLFCNGEQTRSDVQRVSDSFLRISRQGDLLAQRFYERFFALEPGLRELFPSDLGPQARMLTTPLKLTIESLQHPDQLLSFLDELGRRHAHYGVQPRHLGLMGKALLEVLPTVDLEWTDSTGHAWASAYGHIAQLIQPGIENVHASQQLPLGAVAAPIGKCRSLRRRRSGPSTAMATSPTRASAMAPSMWSSRGSGSRTSNRSGRARAWPRSFSTWPRSRG